MSRFTRILAATAVATAAIAGPLAASAQATPTADGPLVNVVVGDVASSNEVVLLNNVTVAAAAVCGVNVNVLSAELLTNDIAACPAQTTPVQTGWVALL